MSLTFSWYVVNVLPGAENKVILAIQEEAKKRHLEDSFSEILAPAEEVRSTDADRKKKTRRNPSQKKFLPGYILVRMVLTDETWALVTGVPKVFGFIGSERRPQPVSDGDIAHILKRVEEGVVSDAGETYDIGEEVYVTSGPFADFTGRVEVVFPDKKRLKVGVSILGRSTPVELEFVQVRKV